MDTGRVLVASVLLYGAGMVLNDHADQREDARHRPERPIPAGQVASGTALAFGLVLLAGALVLTPIPIYHGSMALLVLGYDYLLKRVAALGALAMGTLRGLNLSAGAVLAIPEGSRLPAEDVLYAAAAYAIYILAVTFLGILEDEPRPPKKAIRGLIWLPPLAVFLTLLVMPQPWPAAAVALVLAIAFLSRNRHAEWRQAEVRNAMTWLLLGTMVFTALLCLSAGRWLEAAIIAIAVLPARWIARRISLT